ncbi:hypothetical protein ACFCYB_13640 [Streptomyces sp. NPDC056309]|uniref:hypothetical protein n=1 Tax=unclassified Streptomyces TaxID=2593676 RepID=UPI0035E1E4B1
MPPDAVVVLAACWSFTDSHVFWSRGMFIMLGFAPAFALLTVETSRPGASRSGVIRLTNL